MSRLVSSTDTSTDSSNGLVRGGGGGGGGGGVQIQVQNSFYLLRKKYVKSWCKGCKYGVRYFNDNH